MEEKKPIYQVDIFPSPDSWTWTGYLLFFISYSFVIMLLIFYDIWLFILGNLIFVLGGFCGRMIEDKHYKNVLKKMGPEVCQKFKELEYLIAKTEYDDAKKNHSFKVKRENEQT